MDEIIDNKYEIIKIIGRGGMGKIYLARDKHFNKYLAIKEVLKNNGMNDKFASYCLSAEMCMIKKLDHPSIPQIVDIIESDTSIYIVMEYIEGKTLSAILESDGSQAQDLVIDWAIKLCDVLEYLHTRQPPIIYRDMKPSNIMLTEDGNLKLIDFGTARELKENNIADTVALGTMGYAAPEQFGGMGQTDQRTDIYCLGATLYHLLTGHNPCEPPYEMYPLRRWNPLISIELEKIIEKCTQRNPDNRYQSCAELIYALEHYEELCYLYEKRNKGIYLIWSLVKNIFEKRKYVNEVSLKSKESSVKLDDALYMAEILANIQKDERDCTTLRGPDYNG